jgi:hypothetical protein
MIFVAPLRYRTWAAAEWSAMSRSWEAELECQFESDPGIGLV